MNQRPWIPVVTVIIVAAVGTALGYAIVGPNDRSGPVASAFAALASTLAALAAIHLSRQALARTDAQLAATHRATVLSRYPLLLPIHQSITFPDYSGRIGFHPPSKERFELKSSVAGSYAFVEDSVKDAFIIPVENAGEGPALGIVGRLWRNDGAAGETAGPATLAVGGRAIMTARLQKADGKLPRKFEEEICGRVSGTYFWLELFYFDIFNNARASRSVFNPDGTGAWLHCYEPATKNGDQISIDSAPDPGYSTH